MRGVSRTALRFEDARRRSNVRSRFEVPRAGRRTRRFQVSGYICGRTSHSAAPERLHGVEDTGDRVVTLIEKVVSRVSEGRRRPVGEEGSP